MRKTFIYFLLTVFMICFCSCSQQPNSQQSNSEPDYGIEVSNVTIDNSARDYLKWGGDWYVSISGTLHNKSDKNYDMVTVEFEILDKYGDVTATISEWYRLDSGASLNFREGDIALHAGSGYKIRIKNAFEE